MVAMVAADGEPLFLCRRRLDRSPHRRDPRRVARVVQPGALERARARADRAQRPGTQDIGDGPNTGAVAAAATTSLPESIGGPKNWDYRFSWVRDAALTIDALAVLGLQEEVHAAVSWLLRRHPRQRPRCARHVHPGRATTRRPTPTRGPRVQAQPTRQGGQRRASSQIQLGVYGDLFGTVADWVFGGHLLDVGSARELSDLADRCADVWRDDDAGIWELRHQPRLHIVEDELLASTGCRRAAGRRRVTSPAPAHGGAPKPR